MSRIHFALIVGGYVLAAAVFGVIQHYVGSVPQWDDAAIFRAIFSALSLLILSWAVAAGRRATHPGALNNSADFLKFWGLVGVAVGFLVLVGRHHSIF